MKTSLIASWFIAALLLAPAATPTDYQVETVADGLSYPWSLTFLPDGEMLVTERTGQLRTVSADGTVGNPIRAVPAAYVKSQGGLLDVVLHPDFESNRLVYLSLAAGAANDNATTIVRGQLDGDGLSSVETVFEVAPRKDTAVHYGGRMLFLPDQTLLLTTGDGFNYREAAQDLSNQMGKVIRMTDSGQVPPDNPYVGDADADPFVYSYGHRNPQGLALDAVDQTVWLHEHGPRGGDELNLIEPGNNYGWPVISYGLDYSGAKVTPLTQRDGMEQPLVDWTPSLAVSGLAVYRGDAFTDWRGDLLVGTLVERSLRRLVLKDGKIIRQHVLLNDLDHRIRDVRVGPDGFVYLLTDAADGKLLRLRPR